MTLQDNLLGLVPVAVLHGTLEVGAVVAVEVLENAVLVLEAAMAVDGRVLDGSEAPALLAAGGRGCGGEASRGGCGGQDAVRGAVEGLGSGGVPSKHGEVCRAARCKRLL